MLIQDAVQCLIPAILEKSSTATTTARLADNMSPLITHQVTPSQGSSTAPFVIPKSTGQNPSPLVQVNPVCLSTGQMLQSPSPGPSREDSVQSRMSALFQPYPRRMGSKQMRSRKTYQTPWSHDFFCLAHPETDVAPSLEERSVLQSLGLGKKRITFCDNNGSHAEFCQKLMNAYPQLQEAGGFKLMRCGRSRRLVDIPMPSAGYSVRFLRLDSGLNKALAYILPLQLSIGHSIQESEEMDKVKFVLL